MVALTQKMKETFSKSCETLAGMGERVLGFVHLDLDPSFFLEGFQFSTEGDEPNFPLDGICFIGLMIMMLSSSVKQTLIPARSSS